MRNIFILLLILISTLPLSADAQIDSIRGFTEPYRSIDLAAEEMGTLFEVAVTEGTRVKAGDVVAKLNEQVLLATRAVAANNSAAKGKLHSALAELQIQLDKKSKIEGLFKRNHASQTELDRVAGQVKVAEAQVEMVRDELKQRSLELERIDAQLELRKIRSPIDGIVIRVHKDAGEFVSATDPNVATVVQLDPLMVVFNVPYDYSHRIREGQKVQVLIGLEKKVADTVVEFISPITDAQSGTRRVKVILSNKNNAWESGQVCILKIPPRNAGRIAGSKPGVLTVGTKN